MALKWSTTTAALGLILLLAFHVQEGEGSQHHFVLIHGLGHGAWCWYKIVTLLKQKGHTVAALDLTSNGINRAASTDQVKSIAHYAEPLLQYIGNLGNDEKVTLVGHSLGGCPLSYAMEMYPTKISKAIFISAFTPRNNQSFLSSANPKTFPRLVENGVVVPNMEADSELPISASLALDHVKSYLYNKSPVEDANLAESLLTSTPFPISVEFLKLSEESYGSIRRFYIVLMKDRLFPPEYQEYSIAQNPPEKVFKMHASDHSPFFSQPDQLCNLLIHIATL
uniref:AB hydrolase-1 domain-containing protein n=1 Tax=Picea sitchensis TaxID=3332 RepID=A9NLN3_PICSI|nr:unknown [Picea sitchensis]